MFSVLLLLLAQHRHVARDQRVNWWKIYSLVCLHPRLRGLIMYCVTGIWNKNQFRQPIRNIVQYPGLNVNVPYSNVYCECAGLVACRNILCDLLSRLTHCFSVDVSQKKSVKIYNRYNGGSRFNNKVADDLTPILEQAICNYHIDL